MLSGNTVKGEIAYGVIAGFMWVLWMAVAIWSQFRSSGSTMTAVGTGKGNAGLDNAPEKLGRDEAA